MNQLSCTEYARRHVDYRLSLKRQAILAKVTSLADARGTGDGYARTTQWMIAEDAGVSLSTVERLMRWLLDPDSGPVLIKAKGRGYIVVGYVTHDATRCGNVECQSDVRNSHLSSARQRANARERARRYRARKAAERHGG